MEGTLEIKSSEAIVLSASNGSVCGQGCRRHWHLHAPLRMTRRTSFCFSRWGRLECRPSSGERTAAWGYALPANRDCCRSDAMPLGILDDPSKRSARSLCARHSRCEKSCHEEWRGFHGQTPFGDKGIALRGGHRNCVALLRPHDSFDPIHLKRLLIVVVLGWNGSVIG